MTMTTYQRPSATLKQAARDLHAAGWRGTIILWMDDERWGARPPVPYELRALRRRPGYHRPRCIAHRTLGLECIDERAAMSGLSAVERAALMACARGSQTDAAASLG